MGDQDLAITVDVVVSRRFCVFNEKNQPENKYILCHKRMYWYVGKIRSYIFHECLLPLYKGDYKELFEHKVPELLTYKSRQQIQYWN